MRTREEIVSNIASFDSGYSPMDKSVGRNLGLLVEVMTDIRDLLTQPVVE